MPPEIKFYLVGSMLTGKYRRDGDGPHDIDVVGVVSEKEFMTHFGYNHQQLMDDFKKEPRPPKLQRYLECNRGAGWVLSQLLGKPVDFKFCLPTMLYNPNGAFKLETTMVMEV